MKPEYINPKTLANFIENALEEDIKTGDYSSLATLPDTLIQKAKLIVKEDCILAGVEMAKEIFNYYDKDLKMNILLNDGAIVKKGEIAFYVEGKARSILSTERLVLNCMQRMSGIATLTHKVVQELQGTKCKLLDTRKTTPNFRICEKWAVIIGGGNNHRFGLYDMIMLKDNHIDFCGSIAEAVKRTKEYLTKHNLALKIEVETRNIDEVREALNTKIDRIMLDNMNLTEMTEAVKVINNQCETEASGGITIENIKKIAQTGVTYISMGAITHSATNVDLSLKATKD